MKNDTSKIQYIEQLKASINASMSEQNKIKVIKMFYYDIISDLSIIELKAINDCCKLLIQNKLPFTSIPTILSDILFNQAEFNRKEEHCLEYLMFTYKKCLICLTMLKIDDNIAKAARTINVNRTTLLSMKKQFKLTGRHIEK